MDFIKETAKNLEVKGEYDKQSTALGWYKEEGYEPPHLASHHHAHIKAEP